MITISARERKITLTVYQERLAKSKQIRAAQDRRSSISNSAEFMTSPRVHYTDQRLRAEPARVSSKTLKS
jgi:hypothetical protein